MLLITAVIVLVPKRKLFHRSLRNEREKTNLWYIKTPGNVIIECQSSHKMDTSSRPGEFSSSFQCFGK